MGWSGAEQLARGDAEEERVADLAGCSGDGDVKGGFRCHVSMLRGEAVVS